MLAPFAVTDGAPEGYNGIGYNSHVDHENDFQLTSSNESVELSSLKPSKLLNGFKLPSIDNPLKRLTSDANILPCAKGLDQVPLLLDDEANPGEYQMISKYNELGSKNTHQESMQKLSKNLSKSIELSHVEYPSKEKDCKEKGTLLPLKGYNLQNYQKYKTHDSFVNSVQKISIQKGTLLIGDTVIRVGDGCYLYDSGTRFSVTIKSIDDLGVYVQRADGSKSRVWLELLVCKRVSIIKKTL